MSNYIHPFNSTQKLQSLSTKKLEDTYLRGSWFEVRAGPQPFLHIRICYTFLVVIKNALRPIKH